MSDSHEEQRLPDVQRLGVAKTIKEAAFLRLKELVWYMRTSCGEQEAQRLGRTGPEMAADTGAWPTQEFDAGRLTIDAMRQRVQNGHYDDDLHPIPREPEA